MNDTVTIALAGNPNSGKTTLFNTLTGSRQQVGNYPGITVDKREGYVDHRRQTVHIVDLPGTYSLTAYSQEELVARRFLVEEEPAVVVDVVDATNLERNLYLAVQFLELGIPVVLALNMMDEVKKRGMSIDNDKLGEILNTPAVPITARTGQGKSELLSTVQDTAERHHNQPWSPLRISYGPDLDPKLEIMTGLIVENSFLTDRYPPRWVALKYLEEDPEIMQIGRRANAEVAGSLEANVTEVARHCRMTLDTHPEAIIADYRYGFITSLLRQGIISRSEDRSRINFSDQADRVLTHRLLGPVIMFGVLYAMFHLTFGLGEAPLGWVQSAFAWTAALIRETLPPGLLRSLLVSGIIDGVGGVLSFVPLILIMFFGLSFLEDSGYMARMAYMLDRVLRIFGLHGCSVMPFIISGGIPGGCAVPGIMATRTLRSPKEKLATLLTAPFLSCGAKVPVFLLIAGAFFPGSAAAVLFWLTISGWAAALLTARLLRSTIIRGEATPFVMELPPYRLPTLRGLLIHTWERGWQYIRKAGTVILAISILLWAAMTFPGLPEKDQERFDERISSLKQQIQQTERPEAMQRLAGELRQVRSSRARAELKHTLAGQIGTALEPVTQWAGFDWKINISLIGGVAAKEVIVSSLGTAYSLGEVEPESTASISERLARDPSWNKVTGLSLMVFVLLYAPCFVSIVTMAKESSWRWAAFSILFNTALAYAVSVVIYQVGQGVF